MNASELIKAHETFIKTIDLKEGGSCVEQIQYFHDFLQSHTGVKTVLEIGFNAGLSAAGFLSARSDVQVVSVDIGFHPYVLQAKKWIDETFPGRHILIIGDSLSAIPRIREMFTSYSPDLIFIDGGHDAPYPVGDLTNCLALARPDTWLIMDDVVPWMKDIIGPMNELLKDNKMHVFDQKNYNIHGWVLFKKIC
jgi:predicted O-methyltransferase YrrM